MMKNVVPSADIDKVLLDLDTFANRLDGLGTHKDLIPRIEGLADAIEVAAYGDQSFRDRQDEVKHILGGRPRLRTTWSKVATTRDTACRGCGRTNSHGVKTCWCCGGAL